jgi:hypothetical protein
MPVAVRSELWNFSCALAIEKRFHIEAVELGGRYGLQF